MYAYMRKFFSYNSLYFVMTFTHILICITVRREL